MKFSDWIEDGPFGAYPKSQIAQHLGISTSALYSILSGTYLPGLETALAIEKMTKRKVRCEDWLTEKPKDEKQKGRKVEQTHEADESKLNVM